MLSRSLRASRQGIANLTRQHGPVARRAFTATTLRGDMIQDMYLRELKNYKVPQPKPSEADAHVQKFAAPKAPESPEESNLANDLSAYEKQEVEVEGRSGEGEASAAEDDMFEDDLGLDEDEHADAKH